MKGTFREKLKYWGELQLGLLLLTGSVYFFKAPNGFATGGVSGLAILISRMSPALTQAELVAVFNGVLLVLGVVFLGKGFAWKTALCSAIFSLEMWLYERFIPLSAPLTDQPFLELTYAILLGGIGSALLFNCKASSGGTDIAALILKKYTSMDVGKALLVSDVLIAASTFWVVGLKAGLYSLLGLFAKSFLIDGVIEQINLSKAFTIITTRPDEIERYVMEVLHRGITIEKATGGYTGEDKSVLICVCSRLDAARLKRRIKELDPDAFIIVTSSSEILGRGFGRVED